VDQEDDFSLIYSIIKTVDGSSH